MKKIRKIRILDLWTSAGRPFQSRGTAVANDRSPTVTHLDGQTWHCISVLLQASRLINNADSERSRVCATWKPGIRASPAYSVHFLKFCHGVGRRVDTWNYRTDVHWAWCKKWRLLQWRLARSAPSAGDLFRSRRLLHLQCSSSPSWWHLGVFVSQYTRFHLTVAVAAQ